MRYLTVALALAAAAPGHAQDARPKGILISTWVREDIFAGFLGGDMERFEAGMAKVERELRSDPANTDALAWRGGGKLLRAVRAHESGRHDVFTNLYAEARADFDKAAELSAGKEIAAGAFAITGGSYLLFADRLPSGLRREAWTKAQENYLALRKIQEPYFDKLPPHMRGEVMAGLAQSAQRLGDQESADRRLAELIAAMPASVYASRARRWQEQPAIAAKTSVTCQSCHEDGRLEPTLKRLEAKK